MSTEPNGKSRNKILSFMIRKIVKIIPKDICKDRKLIDTKLAYINSRWGTFVNDSGDYEDIIKFEVDNSLYQNLLNNQYTHLKCILM